VGGDAEALWGSNGNGHDMPLEAPRLALGESETSQTTPTPVHYCQQHQAEFKRFEKGGRVWWSHKTGDGKWCRQK